MASNSTIIDDEYCTAMGAYFIKQGQQLDETVSNYISALQAARTGAIKGGDVANALDAYIDYAEKLRNQIGIISNDAKAHITAFLSKVDEADQFLF